jgi:hypothetical protein
VELALAERLVEAGLVGHALDGLPPARGRARLGEDRLEVVADDALAGEHLAPGAEGRGGGELRERDLLRELGLRQQLGEALEVLGAVHPGAAGRAGEAHLAQGEGHRQSGEQDRAAEQQHAEHGHPLLEVAEEAEDRELHQQQHADEDAQHHMHHRARRQLDLVLPQARDHLPHHHDIDDHVDIAERPMQQHQRARGGAGARGVIEGVTPEVEHQEHGRAPDEQEQEAEDQGERHAAATLAKTRVAAVPRTGPGRA